MTTEKKTCEHVEVGACHTEICCDIIIISLKEKEDKIKKQRMGNIILWAFPCVTEAITIAHACPM
jgi:hypothetical protein